MSLALLAQSAPNFWVGLILIAFMPVAISLLFSVRTGMRKRGSRTPVSTSTRTTRQLSFITTSTTPLSGSTTSRVSVSSPRSVVRTGAPPAMVKV